MNIRQLLSFSLFALSACAPVKGYDGPELPPESVATVVVEYDNDELHVSRASLDGIEFGPTGIAVLPGEYSLDLAAAAKEPPTNCRREYRFDDWGYSRCLVESRRSRRRRGVIFCNRQDFTVVIDHCTQQLTDVNCSAVLDVVAGQRYPVRLDKLFGMQGAHESGISMSGPIRSESCSAYRERTVALEIRR